MVIATELGANVSLIALFVASDAVFYWLGKRDQRRVTRLPYRFACPKCQFTVAADQVGFSAFDDVRHDHLKSHEIDELLS